MAALHVVSHSEEPFRDREEAGRLLGEQLSHLAGGSALVLGIPRGGMVVAYYLSRAINAGLDIVLSRKLRTPGHPELAMGSVAEGGQLFLNESVIFELGVTEASIEAERQHQLAEIARRSDLIRQHVPKLALRDRPVVITDDGVATGATMQVALWAIRQERPSRLIAALPVASEGALSRLSQDADEVYCLRVPPFFAAVGQFYRQFDQVGDEEVLVILKKARVTGGVG